MTTREIIKRNEKRSEAILLAMNMKKNGHKISTIKATLNIDFPEVDYEVVKEAVERTLPERR